MAPAYTMIWIAARKWASRSTKMPEMLDKQATMKSRLAMGLRPMTTPKAPPTATAAKM